jgi:hypothetical protein
VENKMNSKLKKLGRIAVFISLAIWAGTALSQRKAPVKSSLGKLQQQLIGTRGVSDIKARAKPEDAWTYPYGDYPKGYFIYGPTGLASIQFMDSSLLFDKFSSGDDRKPTPAEAKTVYDKYVAFFGRYQVDEANHLILYRVHGSLGPSSINTDKSVPFEVSASNLIIGDRKTLQIRLFRME